jgi:tripartite-type tricarboxylate transporter receptor subunit TctC
MKREASIDIVHVPYKGTTQAMRDLLGGQIGMMFGSAPTLMPQVKAGKLRALAVTTARRSPAAPDLPTLVESGMKNLDVPSWYGMLVPIKTPKETITKLHADIAAVLTDLKPTLEIQGLYPVGNSPAEFTAQIKKETALWARIIQDADIKPN